MSRLQVSRAADGFRWRVIAKNGGEVHSSPTVHLSQEAAIAAACEFRQTVALARLVDDFDTPLDVPLVVPAL